MEQIKGIRIRLNRLQVLKYHDYYKQDKWVDFITRQDRPPKNGSYYDQKETEQICKELIEGMKTRSVNKNEKWKKVWS